MDVPVIRKSVSTCCERVIINRGTSRWLECLPTTELTERRPLPLCSSSFFFRRPVDDPALDWDANGTESEEEIIGVLAHGFTFLCNYLEETRLDSLVHFCITRVNNQIR